VKVNFLTPSASTDHGKLVRQRSVFVNYIDSLKAAYANITPTEREHLEAQRGDLIAQAINLRATNQDPAKRVCIASELMAYESVLGPVVL
jgi:hypothetical protein